MLNAQNLSDRIVSPAPNRTELVGWTPESPGRGSLTLLVTCLFTVFLCTWVVIHPRIHGSKHVRLAHKIALSLKTIIAPELIAVESAQEWMQARRMVKESAASTNGKLTLVHAFYVGMLGLRYRTEQGSKVLWPNQLTWLLNTDKVGWEQVRAWRLTLEDLKDRSNADSATKLFALVQVAWFVAQSIMRVVHDLPLAPLESMTLGYIPLFAVTYFFWWTKPKDIDTSTLVDLPVEIDNHMPKLESMSVSKKFDDDGQPESMASIWYLTPRVFEKEASDDRARDSVQQAWTPKSQVTLLPMYQREIKSQCNKSSMALSEEEIVLAHWDPDIYRSKTWPVTCLFGISFGALHLTSWNSAFPSTIEMWLWRSAAISSMIAILVFMHFERISLSWRDPLMLVKILSPALYIASRVIMLAEAFAAFRASDLAIYNTYVVSNYWIHLS